MQKTTLPDIELLLQDVKSCYDQLPWYKKLRIEIVRFFERLFRERQQRLDSPIKPITVKTARKLTKVFTK